MIKQSRTYPVRIQLPTGILLNTLVERNTPVNAPKGESNKDKPKLPSVNPILYLIPGIEATHVPNNRLDEENKNPTANAGFIFIKEEMFLIIVSYEQLVMVRYQVNRTCLPAGRFPNVKVSDTTAIDSSNNAGHKNLFILFYLL